MKKTLALLCLMLVITAIIRCTNDYNPFTNRANATMHIVSTGSSFADADTVDIFQTCTLALAPTVYELIDSFSLETEGSLFFNDTTCRSPQAQTYLYLFSWNDTGRTTITLRNYRDKEELERSVSVYVRSPLHQPSVDTPIETALVLRTPAVRDSVWYHWALTGPLSVTLHSRQNEKDARIDYPGTYKGELWVSTDSLGLTATRSPKVSFSVTLRDTLGPFIECLNYYRNDTIRTGDKDFAFQAHINDLAGIDTATVQGQPFTKKDHPYYRTTLQSLDAYDATHPLSIKVEARDKAGNLSQRLFYAIYDPTKPQTNSTKIEISKLIPNTGTIIATRNQQKLIGTIEDNTRSSVTMTAEVNGSAQAPKLIPLEDGVGEWDMNILLNAGVNSVTLLAHDSVGATLAEKNVTIIYDAAAIDSTPPILMELTANDKIITPGQLTYVSDSTATIAFLAFDNSGIDSATIDQKTILPTGTSSYEYRTSITKITANTPRLLTITLRDSAKNDTTIELRLQHNVLPSIDEFNLWPRRILVGQQLKIDFNINDDDIVEANLALRPPAMTFKKNGLSNNYALSWTPQLADTGKHGFTIDLYDGKERRWFVWPLHVLPDSSKLIKLATTADSIPSYLYTQEKATLALRVEPNRGTPPISFKTMLDQNRTAFTLTSLDTYNAQASIDADSSLTGRHLFTLIACDATGDCDTLMDSLLLLPRPQNKPSISAINKNGIPITSTTGIRLSQNGPDNFLRIAVFDDDHPLLDSLTITLTMAQLNMTYPVKSGDTIHLNLDPLKVTAPDTLKITVIDADKRETELRLPVLADRTPSDLDITLLSTSQILPFATNSFDMSQASSPKELKFLIVDPAPSDSYTVSISTNTDTKTDTITPSDTITVTLDTSTTIPSDSVTVRLYTRFGKLIDRTFYIIYKKSSPPSQLTLNTTLQGCLNDGRYGFPLLVRLDASPIELAQLSPTNPSIAFVNDTQTPLPHEPHYWNYTTSQCRASWGKS